MNALAAQQRKSEGQALRRPSTSGASILWHQVQRTKRRVSQALQVRNTWLAWSSDDVIIAHWWTRKPNWGDALNPVLIKHLSGRRPIPRSAVVNLRGAPVYSVIGSLLDGNRESNLVVWGTGFIKRGGRFRRPPKNIAAVRGPMTRNEVLSQGLSCPEIFGDPALLYPRYYCPPIKPAYDVGIVAHYLDQLDPNIERLAATGSSTVIDITAPIDSVVDQICACRLIASSSLHGLIAADAYGIPSVWIKLAHDLKGDGFKFRDYFASVGRPWNPPLVVSKETRVDHIEGQASDYVLDIDLDALYDACPFRRD